MGFLSKLAAKAANSMAADEQWARYAAGIVLEGQNARLPGWTQKRHRLLQRQLAQQRETPADVLLLGSSRHGFHQSLSASKKVINLWINSAMLGDRLFTYEAYTKRHPAPPVLIIGLDTWMFDARAWRNIQFGASSLPIFAEDYHDIAEKLGFNVAELEAQWSKWRETSIEGAPEWLEDMRFESPGYYASTMKKQKLSLEVPQATQSDVDPQARIIFPDGSFEHAKSALDVSPDEVWVEASRWGAAYGLYMKHGFQQADALLWTIFTRFTEYAKQSGTEIILFFPPFHPAAYHAYRLTASYANEDFLGLLEKKIVEYAGEQKLHVIGSFDPDNCAARASDFVDSWHLQRSLMPRLFDGILDRLA